MTPALNRVLGGSTARRAIIAPASLVGLETHSLLGIEDPEPEDIQG